GDAGPEDVRLDLVPGAARVGLKVAYLVRRGPGESCHGSSPWPTCHVLMTRCCPYVTAMNEPSSTICASLKCSWSRDHTASSAPSGSQTSMLVYSSAAFCLAVKRGDASKRSSSA